MALSRIILKMELLLTPDFTTNNKNGKLENVKKIDRIERVSRSLCSQFIQVVKRWLIQHFFSVGKMIFFCEKSLIKISKSTFVMSCVILICVILIRKLIFISLINI